MKKTVLLLAASLIPLAAATAATATKNNPCRDVSFPTDDVECLTALARHGGNVLYTRHVRTETDFADQDDPTTNLSNCNLQRVVSDEGWEQAAVLSGVIEDFGFETSSVISSQFCRAWQTAVQMYGRLNRKTRKLNFVTEEECGGPDAPDLQECLDRTAQKNLRRLLSRQVRARGKNRALVAHDDPFKSATGYYPFPMGATYVVKPKGKKGFEVLGCVSPDGWYGDSPEFTCNLDPSLTADDFDEGVPEPELLAPQAR